MARSESFLGGDSDRVCAGGERGDRVLADSDEQRCAQLQAGPNDVARVAFDALL